MRMIKGLAGVLALAACGPAPTYMNATVNGELWQAEHVTCFFHSDGPELDVSGSRTTGPETKTFINLVGLPPVPATVSLGDEGPIGVILETDLLGWNVDVGHATTADLRGTVTITEVNVQHHGCGGTFSFVAGPAYGGVTDTVTVSDGAWSVNLQRH